MSDDRAYVEENTRERERLRALVERLDEDGLRLPVNEYWTVAGVFGHIAFWDSRVLSLADKLERGEPFSSSDTEPEDVDWINDASRELIHAVPPVELARLAVSIAEETDARVATLRSTDCIRAIRTAPSTRCGRTTAASTSTRSRRRSERRPPSRVPTRTPDLPLLRTLTVAGTLPDDDNRSGRLRVLRVRGGDGNEEEHPLNDAEIRGFLAETIRASRTPSPLASGATPPPRTRCRRPWCARGSLERGRPIESLPAWVASVALNLTRSGWRRTAAERRAGTSACARSASPSRRRRARTTWRWPARSRRCHAEREVAVLRYLLGFDTKETAAVLSIGEGTVKSCSRGPGRTSRTRFASAIWRSTMSKVDDELTRRFRWVERPVDVDGLFEGLEAALAPRTRPDGPGIGAGVRSARRVGCRIRCAPFRLPWRQPDHRQPWSPPVERRDRHS